MNREASGTEAAPDAPDCRRCKHHYITWEVAFPYGCRVFSIKSRILPMLEVQRSSGESCKAFEPKPPPQRA